MATWTRLGVFTVSLAFLCTAQVNRGTLTGMISIPQARSVPAVKVRDDDVETGTSAATAATDTGNYTLPALPSAFTGWTLKPPVSSMPYETRSISLRAAPFASM